MIQLSDIQSALERIRADIRISPCTHSETFSGLTNNSIFLKLDNQQRTGAFKERGALNKLLTLNPDERARIVMPLPTPLTKVSATRAYGAEVLLHCANNGEGCEKAVERSENDRITLI